jgi:uncharacterized repeat protein (TIGR03806 family)
MRLATFLLVSTAFAAGYVASFGRAPAEKPFGIPKRIPWTTSRVVGTPDPPSPYTTERAFPKLRFDRSLDINWNAADARWMVCEHSGAIWSFPADEKVERPDLFLDLRKKNGIQIWSMTLHPRYKDNGFVYVCYFESKPQPNRCRISRFTVNRKNVPKPLSCDLETEFIVCEWLGGEDHWGGCLKFGLDGYLYFSVGDGSGYADGNESGQDLSDFNASILRIDVDKQDKGKAYAVPPDNPFVKLPGARPEIWAYGVRNVWKMSIDRQTGDLWAADVGQDLWETVLKVEKGGNYGWSVTEGTHPFRPARKVGPTPILKPVAEHDHSEFRSITGGFVYRGNRFKDLFGAYVYADYETGKIWGLRYDGKKLTWQQELTDTPFKLVGFGEDGDGELLILDYTGMIHRLGVNAAKPRPGFPKLLSQTGLFRSVKDHEPAAGVIPYSVNSPLWSDGAHKDRFLALPGESKIEYDPKESWKFPEGTVLVKTFSLDLQRGKPASRRRLETRLLHLEEDHWRGYTYLWNEGQTDAELLGRGSLERVYTIKEAGGERKQTWHFPSRAECTLCHTMPARFVLGLSTPQMNRDHDYGGVIDNQLRTLDHIGLFTKPIASFHKEGERPRLTDPLDAHQPLEKRARSYLHANCAHCHMKWGGGNALFELTWPLSLEETRTVGVAPMHGGLGETDAKLLIPGNPRRSLIYRRMAIVDNQRMPRVGSSVVDDDGAKLIRKWIAAMKEK